MVTIETNDLGQGGWGAVSRHWFDTVNAFRVKLESEAGWWNQSGLIWSASFNL